MSLRPFMAEAALDHVRIEAGWKAALADAFNAEYMAQLRAYLIAERAKGARNCKQHDCRNS